MAPEARRDSLVSLDRSGKNAAYLKSDGIELIRLSDRFRDHIDTASVPEFAYGGGGLWVLADGTIYWIDSRGRIVAEVFVGEGASALNVSRGALPSAVFCGADHRLKLVELYDGQLFCTDIDWVRGHVVSPNIQPIGPRTLVVGGPGALCLIHVDRGLMWSHLIPPSGLLRAATALFAGTSIATLFDGGQSTLLILGPNGEPLSGHDPGVLDVFAIAEDRGVIFSGTGRKIRALDLLDDGRVYEATLPFIPDAMDTCSRGRELAFAQRDGDRVKVWHAGFTDIFGDWR